MPLARSVVAIIAAVAAPACGPAEDHCEGNTAVRCTSDEWLGSNCNSEDCGEAFCVEPEVGNYLHVLCAPEPEPRLECLDEELEVNSSGYWTCAGAEKYFCRGGYLLHTTDCGAPELCHVGLDYSGGRDFHCILSATQDPRCLPLLENEYFGSIMSTCDGTLSLGCFDGYLATVEDCAATGSTCQDGYCRQ